MLNGRKHSQPKRAESLPRTDPKTQICGPSLMVNENVAVGHELDLVHIEIGGTRLSLHYSQALQLSGLLRVHGKHAKRLAGDQSTHFGVFATLTDAEEDYKRGFK